MVGTLVKKSDDDQLILIKKYANRRLYNTATSSYVTLDHLCTMVKEGTDFVVEDAKTGEDITRSVLTQIIFEEENKGQNLLPIQFLRQLIGYYGDNLEQVVPKYLEMTMDSFAHNQDAMREQMSNTFGGANPFAQFEDLTRRNVSLFQQAMTAFTPFPQAAASPEPAPEPAPVNPADQNDDLSSLKDKLADLEKQINSLSRDK